MCSVFFFFFSAFERKATKKSRKQETFSMFYVDTDHSVESLKRNIHYKYKLCI